MFATNLDSYHRTTVMPETNTKILVCNAGSSSFKFSLFDAEEEVLLAEGGIDWIKKPTRLVFRRPGQPEIREELQLEKHADAAARILDDLQAGPSAALHSLDELRAVPTLETLATVDLLHHYAPDLKMRVINVVDLMKLQPHTEHPHGVSDHDFDALFTTDKPIVFAFHGYPWLIHRLTYRRAGHRNLHVRGYKEEVPQARLSTCACGTILIAFTW